jgi:predicted ATPase
MIESLHLMNFKNFQDAKLLLGKVTLLVGTNASGKSNLRDAFRFLHGIGRGYALAEIFGEKYIGGILEWKGIRGGTREVTYHGRKTFTLTTSFDSTAGGAIHAIEVEAGGDRVRPRVVRESVRQPELEVFSFDPSHETPKKADPPFILVRQPSDSRGRKVSWIRFDESQPVVSQFSHNPQAKAGLIAYTKRIIEAYASMRFLELAPEAMRLPSVPGQVVLGDRGENLSSVLQAICETAAKKRAILEWIRQLTPLDVVDLDFVADQAGRILISLIEAGGQRTSAYSASDGTLRFLAVLAAMLGPDPARLYFFEELDTGIHPTRLHLLLQLIEQAVSTQDIQVVATTHSPQLLAMLSAEARESASLVYRSEATPEARILRIMDIPEARRILEAQDLARLHQSGWLEDAVSFAESAEAGT